MSETVKTFFRTEGFFVSLIILFVAAAFSPVLFGGQAFFDEEQIGFYYPHSFFYSNALGEDTSLLWNNGYYAGISVPFDQFVSAYFPLNRILFSFFDYLTAHHLSIFIGVALGSIFAYLFGRLFKFSKSASFVLAASYLLSTTFGWLDIGTLTAWSFFIIPALFFAVAKISRGERPILWTVLGGIFLGIGFLAGFVQIVFYGYVIAGVFALYLFFTEKKDGKWYSRFGTLLSFGMITVLGVLISLPQTLPSLLLVGESIRTTAYAAQKAATPGIAGLAAFFLPEYMGINVSRGIVIGGAHGGFYPGALSLIAGIMGVLLWRGKIQTFFLLLYAGIMLTAFHIPPFSWLNDNIQPFSRFSSSFRWTIAAAFPLAFLAASGYQGILNAEVFGEKEKRIFKYIGWGIAVLFLAVIAASIVIFVFVGSPDLQSSLLDWYLEGKNIVFSREHYENVLRLKISDAESAISILNWRAALPFLLLLFSFFIIRRFREGRIGKSGFEKLSLFLVSINVLMIPAAIWNQAFFPASIIKEKPAIVRTIEEREEDLESFRIAGFMIGETIFQEITSKRTLSTKEHAKLMTELLVNNLNVVYGIDRLDGAEFYRTLRHNLMLDTVIFPRGLTILDREVPLASIGPLRREYNIEVLKTVTFEEKKEEFFTRLPLLSAFNVKYIYSLVPLAHPELEEIPLSSVGIDWVSIYLYENKNPLPRVYFTEGVNFSTGNENALLDIMTEIEDFRETTLVECDGCPSVSDGFGTIEILRYEDGLLEVEVDSEKDGPSPRRSGLRPREGGWLVFNESFSPGWRALVDGVETPIYRTNYIVQGIYIPVGLHKVEFNYIGAIAKNFKPYGYWLEPIFYEALQ